MSHLFPGNCSKTQWYSNYNDMKQRKLDILIIQRLKQQVSRSLCMGSDFKRDNNDRIDRTCFEAGQERGGIDEYHKYWRLHQ